MLRKRLQVVLIAGALLSFVVLAATSPAAAAGGWRGMFDALLGEGGTHLVLVRGTVQFDGVPQTGGDFTVSKTGTGEYFVAFTGGTFTDTPTVLVQVLNSPFCATAGSNFTVDCIAYTDSGTFVGFNVETKNLGVLDDISFKFIAIGR